MKAKTLFILLGVLVLLGAAGAWIIHLNAPKGPDEKFGAPFLGRLSPNQIKAVTLEGPQGSVSLARKEGRWVVEDRYDYPADFSKIVELVRKLREAKIGRVFEASEETLKRLSLRDPSEPGAEGHRAIRIALKDAEGRPAATILLGKIRSGEGETSFPDSQYVRLGEEPKAYLIDQYFSSLKAEPGAWLDKALVKAPSKDIQKIRCLEKGGDKVCYTLRRPAPAKPFEAEALPEGKALDRPKVNRLAGALASLQVEDVLRPSDAPTPCGPAHSPRIEYRLFDGTVYRVYPGRAREKQGPYYLRLEVTYPSPPPVEDQAQEGGKAEKDTSEDKVREVKELNERLSPWVFVIPQWKYEALATDLDQLLEKQKKNEGRGQG